ncbi:MAG: undecaprenyl-diphosphate phosphatase [Geminicoccaceae bacterium]
MLQIAVLALVQGITEFLPISSSGHLVLTPILFGWPDQGILIDVAVHVGTLVAVVIYFGRDVLLMLRGVGSGSAVAASDSERARGGRPIEGRRLLIYVIVATIPVIAVGLAISVFDLLDGMRNITVIGWTMLVFGIILWLADRYGTHAAGLGDMRLIDALLIGLAQVLALIPGTSRSGITMSMGRALGFKRDEAARFSLLLAIPTIAAAGLLATKEIIELGELSIGRDAIIGAILAGLSAWLAIWAMMGWLRRASFTPFVIYRVILGLILLAIAYS